MRFNPTTGQMEVVEDNQFSPIAPQTQQTSAQAPIIPAAPVVQQPMQQQVDEEEIVFAQPYNVPVNKSQTQTQTSISPGIKVLPEVQKKLETTNKTILDQQQKINAAKAEEARLQAERAEDERKAIELQNSKMQLNEATRQDLLKKEDDKLTEMTEEVKNAKIDPENFWANNGGTAGKILAALLSGMGMGMGMKEPFQIITGAVNDDLQLQKTNLDKKQQNIANQNNILARMRQKYADERTAEQATKIAMLEASKAKFDEMIAKVQIPAKQAELQQQSAKIEQEIVLQKQDLAAKAQNKVNTVIQRKDEVANATNMTKEQVDIAKDLGKRYEDTVKPARETVKIVKDVKTKVEEARAGNETAVGAIKGAFAKYAQGGTGVISDQDLKTFGLEPRFARNMLSKLSQATVGELTKEEMDNLDKLMNAVEANERKEIARIANGVLAAAAANGMTKNQSLLVIPDKDEYDAGINYRRKKQATENPLDNKPIKK